MPAPPVQGTARAKSPVAVLGAAAVRAAAVLEPGRPAPAGMGGLARFAFGAGHGHLQRPAFEFTLRPEAERVSLDV